MTGARFESELALVKRIADRVCGQQKKRTHDECAPLGCARRAALVLLVISCARAKARRRRAAAFSGRALEEELEEPVEVRRCNVRERSPDAWVQADASAVHLLGRDARRAT